MEKRIYSITLERLAKELSLEKIYSPVELNEIKIE